MLTLKQDDGEGQQQVKGDVKEVMERLLPPRPSSSNSCEREKDLEWKDILFH